MASDERQDILLRLVSDFVASSTAPKTAPDVLGDVSRYLGGGAVKAAQDLDNGHASAARPTADAVVGQVVLDQNSESQMTQFARHLLELTRATQAQAETVDSNTQAVIENSLAATSGGQASTGASIGRTVLSYLGGGLGLTSLFGKLFGSSKDEPAPSLVRYSLPSPVSLDAGLSQTPLPGIHPIRYASDGLPRALPTGTTNTATPVTIQVQAMDSRSFLDHSSEIAHAVREALLNSHALNDVVLEL